MNTIETRVRGNDVVDIRVVPVAVVGLPPERDGRGNRFLPDEARIRYTRPGHGDAWLVDVTVSGRAILRDGVMGSHERSARYGENTVRDLPGYLLDVVGRYHPELVEGWRP